MFSIQDFIQRTVLSSEEAIPFHLAVHHLLFQASYEVGPLEN